MKTVFLFPGQGAQFPGMLKDFCNKGDEESVAANDVIALAEKITGENIRQYMWDLSAEEMARSDRSQLAITVMSLAMTAALKVRGIEPDVCAGFSLGEFSALYGSGVLSMEDTIKLVWQRGKIMQSLCEEIAKNSSDGKMPGMAAVMGLDPEKIVEVVNGLDFAETGKNVFAANMNSPKQTVIAGSAEGLEMAEAALKEAGARRVIRLKVAGPFHSPLMEKAGKEFGKILEEVTFNNPKKILLSNVTGGEVKDAISIKENLIKHFTHPVLWTNEEKVLSELIDAKNSEVASQWKIFEVGPGSVLSGLWRDSGFSENISCEAVVL